MATKNSAAIAKVTKMKRKTLCCQINAEITNLLKGSTTHKTVHFNQSF